MSDAKVELGRRLFYDADLSHRRHPVLRHLPQSSAIGFGRRQGDGEGVKGAAGLHAMSPTLANVGYLSAPDLGRSRPEPRWKPRPPYR